MKTLGKQTGVSLVELMLAILISSFLLLGVTEIFSGTKRTYLYQQVQGMSNENQRIASVLLTNILHQIGYVPITRESIIGKHKVFTVSAGTSNTFEAGEAIKGTSQVIDGLTQDTITYRYFAGDEIVTCSGQPLNLNTLSTGVLEFRQRTETLSIDANGHLICTGATQIGSATPQTETVVLIGDAYVDPFQRIIVQEMIISYGVDSDDDNSVDFYATADAIDTHPLTNTSDALDETHWHRIKTLKLELIIKSGSRAPERTEYIVHLENLIGTET